MTTRGLVVPLFSFTGQEKKNLEAAMTNSIYQIIMSKFLLLHVEFHHFIFHLQLLLFIKIYSAIPMINTNKR